MPQGIIDIDNCLFLLIHISIMVLLQVSVIIFIISNPDVCLPWIYLYSQNLFREGCKMHKAAVVHQYKAVQMPAFESDILSFTDRYINLSFCFFEISKKIP